MAHSGRHGGGLPHNNNSNNNNDNSNSVLPTYREATTRPDWLSLVATYVPVRDYARLCLVSRRFYHEFAPRLWNDPLAVLRMLHPDHDPDWVRGLLAHAAAVRADTLSLVVALDARPLLSAASSAFPQYAETTAPLSHVLASIARVFPQLRCLLLDGYPGLEPEGPANPLAAGGLPPAELPLLLSIARCQTELPPAFFASAYPKSLVYLDVSDMPGSLRSPLAKGTFSPASLPSLRILKAQGRRMDDATATLLFRAFQQQLWSLDLGRNKLTDGVLDAMHRLSFPTATLRTDRFAVEGRHVVFAGSGGNASFGHFCFVSESQWSQSFSHPHRHLADPPCYAYDEGDGPPWPVKSRLNGLVEIRPDSADALKRLFTGGPGSHPPALAHAQGLDVCQGHHGITHLYLSGNDISAAGLARMVRSSPGQLQRLECDSVSFGLPAAAPPSWLSRAKLSGTLGAAHVFRPVFSADLQALRVHHSLVTQILSVDLLAGLPPAARLWLAETHLLPRAELAYPEAFVPDMNPRLRSLVLTRIPRRSSGPLIDKLVNFLRLASVQERQIQDLKADGVYASATLPGLRHIRLEFEPDLSEGFFGGGPDEYELDAGAVLDDATKDFSFFSDSSWSSSPPPTAPSRRPQAIQSARPPSARASPVAPDTPAPAAEPHAPARSPDPSTKETPPCSYARHTWTWNNREYTSFVFLGELDSPAPAVREYARLVRAHRHLQADPVSVTPCHVAAGMPRGERIFGRAWEAVFVPSASSPSCTPVDVPSLPTPTASTPTAAAAAAAAAGDTSASLGVSGSGGIGQDGGGAVDTTIPTSANASASASASASGSDGSGTTTATSTTSTSTTSTSTGTTSTSTTQTPHPILTPIPTPTPADLRSMRDVVAEIKEYRLATRHAYDELCRRAAREERGGGSKVKLGAPHFWWSGSLEVLV